MTSQTFARIAGAIVALAAPSVAAAQQATPSAPNQGGPMVIEQVTERYAVGPEVKIGSFDGTTGIFVGGHGGVIVGHSVLVGAGFDTLVNGDHGRGMTYLGGVVGWQALNSGLFSANIRALIGGGWGTTSQATTPATTFADRAGHTFTQARLLSSDFFIAEPQAELLVRLSSYLQLAVGAGYRLTNASYGLGQHFNGASGGFALRVGPAGN